MVDAIQKGAIPTQALHSHVHRKYGLFCIKSWSTYKSWEPLWN